MRKDNKCKPLQRVRVYVFENNGNEEVLYTPQISRNEASSSDAVYSYTSFFGGGISPLCREYSQRILSPTISAYKCLTESLVNNISFSVYIKELNFFIICFCSNKICNNTFHRLETFECGIKITYEKFKTFFPFEVLNYLGIGKFYQLTFVFTKRGSYVEFIHPQDYWEDYVCNDQIFRHQRDVKQNQFTYRFWNRVAGSISFNDNHYTPPIYIYIYIYIYIRQIGIFQNRQSPPDSQPKFPQMLTFGFTLYETKPNNLSRKF